MPRKTPIHTTARKGEIAVNIETHDQYRKLIDCLEAGDVLPDDTHEAMVAFAKSKKIKTPPPNNEPAPEPEPKPKRITNKDKVCSEEGCDRQADSRGLCKRHHTAQWRKDPVNLERTRVAARKHSAKKRFLDMVALIGPGFHPDTAGADYETLPDGWTAERVDQVVKVAISYDLDVYALALDVTGANAEG